MIIACTSSMPWLPWSDVCEEVKAVDGATRDEVTDDAAVPSIEEEEAVDEKDDSEGVRDTGEISAASAASGVSASGEDFDKIEPLDLE